MEIQLRKNKGGKWYYRTVFSNGRIANHSQAYASKDNCVQGVNDFVRAIKQEIDIVIEEEND